MWSVDYDEVMYNNEEQGLFRSKLEIVSSREYIPPVQNVSPGCSIRTSLMLFTGQCMLRKGLHVDSQSTWVQIHAGNSGSMSHDILSVFFLLHTCTVTKTRVEVLLHI